MMCSFYGLEKRIIFFTHSENKIKNLYFSPKFLYKYSTGKYIYYTVC